ncbi:MAG: ATP synthase F0 subunit B [Oscillospiraceae bacterium]|nr:ATP synthase F0 subunit B [Oscillospiraceae bacterium]
MFDIVLTAEGLSPGRLFGLDQQTLLQAGSHLLNVGLLAIVLSWLLYKPVRNMMQKRTERIRDQLDHAADELAKAGELKALYEQKLRDIEKEKDVIIDAARKQATDTGRRLVEEAKEEAETVKTRAHANVEMEWEHAQSGMKQAILEVSAAMAGKMVAAALNKEAQEKLFDETMAELEGTSWRS